MKTKIKIEENNVLVQSSIRSITVKKDEVGDNVIHIKGLTSLVGKKPAAQHFLSEDELIKNTILALTDEGVLTLALAIKFYVGEVLWESLTEKN